MDKIFSEMQNAIIKSLNNKSNTQISEENLKISQEFPSCRNDKKV